MKVTVRWQSRDWRLQCRLPLIQRIAFARIMRDARLFRIVSRYQARALDPRPRHCI